MKKEIQNNRFQIIIKVIVGVSVLLAIIVLFYIVFMPDFYTGLYTGQSESATIKSKNILVKQPVKIFNQSFIEVNGWGGLIPLLIPVVFSILGFWTLFWKNKANKIVLWSSSILVLLFSFLSIFSIGLFFIPTALLLITAAVLNTFSSNKNIELKKK